MTGRFIVLEGGEGAGKSTQARRLAEHLGAVLTREPGGTPLGERLRELLLDPQATIGARAEALMMAAARAQHVDHVVRPALESGRDVVCDRYTYSSIAYQGFGRGLDPAEVAGVSGWATEDLWPDAVVLIDVPEELAATRLDRSLDRFEQADAEFHRRVRGGFAAQAAADPGRWSVIDGSGTPDVVWGRVRDVVEARWGP